MTKPYELDRRRGFTLVEILVVLAIATIVLTLAIPRIRTVNKERNTREAARVVGSTFANASQRGIIDGVAGVRITRNPNFEQAGLQFAATEISLLRAVPPYRGDSETARITNMNVTGSAAYFIHIDEPLEQDSLNIVQVGDMISFNDSNAMYRITNVFPNQDENGGLNGRALRLELEEGGPNASPAPTRPIYLPAPADRASYTIHRAPRILESSTTTLPENYIIDLRFSGFEVLDDLPTPQLATVFEPTVGGAVNNNDIEFIFDEEGAFDRVLYKTPGTNNVVASRLPLGTAHFLITEAPRSVEMTEAVASAEDTALWVSVSASTGSTNVGYNNAIPSTGQTYQTMTNLYDTDRNAFNAIVNECREGSSTSSANQ